ncbi:MAG: hypothetical protein NT016_03610 [Candidatus Aenigmarchaeota archaeon]|nr:hypothetical protein [Candidatus Aenigmarchaeota archaeon]
MSKYSEVKNLILDKSDILSAVLPMEEYRYLVNKYSSIRPPEKKEQKKDLEYLSKVLGLN